DANAYSARNAAYDVAKLVGKKLLRRIDRSRRYAVDPPAIRTLCAYLLLREKIIKPLLAGINSAKPFKSSASPQPGLPMILLQRPRPFFLRSDGISDTVPIQQERHHNHNMLSFVLPLEA